MSEVPAARAVRPPLSAVAVVVPARDERQLLPGCLDALAAAAARTPLPTTVVVVLDRCTDGTEQVVRGRDVLAVRTSVGAAGAARRLGVRRALYALAGSDPVPAWPQVWVASTDADSTVPPDWLAQQVRLADSGVDLVLGPVELPPEHIDPVTLAWRRAYARSGRAGGGRHVHGANLGVRAGAYLAAGGFPWTTAHEDVALSRAVARLPGAVVATGTAPVVTSARLIARAPCGVAADLRRIAQAAAALTTGPLRVAGAREGDYAWGHGGPAGATAVPVPATG